MSSREELARAQNALATSHFRAGRLDEAEQVLREALTLTDRLPELHLNLGLVLIELDRGDDALATLDRALALDGDFAEALQARARMRMHRGEFPEALEDLEAVHRIWMADGTGPVLPMARLQLLSDLGSAALEAGRPSEALERYREALALSPSDPRLRMNLGLLHEKVGDRAAALEQYREARRFSPGDLYAALRLATLHASERPRRPDHRKEAVDTLVEVLGRDNANEPPQIIARAFFLLGSLHDDEDDQYPEAVAAYRRGLEVQPDFPQAHNNLGALYMSQGDLKRARHHLERALALDPASRNVHKNLARLIYHQLTLAEGSQLFARAVAPGPEKIGEGLFGVAQALIDLASVEAYEDFYSRGHQVKNRVGLAASRVKQLARQARDPLGAPRHELANRLDELLADHENLYQMLAEIIRVVRPETMSPVLVDPADALRRLTRRMQAANRGRAKIRLAPPGKRIPRLRLDPARMSEAIENVVQNGIDAITDRWGDEAPKNGLVTLTIDLAIPSREVVLTIEDNGPGIKPVSLQEVFRAGFTTKPAGSGLGLAITRRIVGDHGGTLEVEGRPGTGARFTIRLPVDAEARHIPLGLSSRPVILTESESLLVDELA